MNLLLGNSLMKRSDYEGAVQSFERLRQTSGWKFDNLDVTVRQRLREALYAAGRTKDASKSHLKLVNTFAEAVYMSGSITEWISGEFTFTCLLFYLFKLFRQRLPIDTSPFQKAAVV